MNQQSFLILHGLGGSGPDHWQTWLSQELSKRGYPVYYPTFSNFTSPDKNVWLKELSSTIERIPANQSLTVITHSLGCLLWLHYAASQNKRIANRVILVAPPSPKVVLPEAKSFFTPPLNGSKLQSSADETWFIYSTNDPYCSVEDSSYYKNLGAATVTIENAGHINPASGYGKWPWILEFSLAESSKLPVSI